MAKNLETTVRSVALKLAKALEDAAQLRVETRCIVLSGEDADIGEGEKGRLIARTTMQLDGDSEVVVPVNRAEDGELKKDDDLLELHLRNVSTALEYRSRILDSLLSIVR